jgi:hypothetical protein
VSNHNADLGDVAGAVELAITDSMDEDCATEESIAFLRSLERQGYAVVRVGDVPTWMERYGTVLEPGDYPSNYDHWTPTTAPPSESTTPVWRLHKGSVEGEPHA